MKYDAILVLGLGIREDGSLPESAQALVKKAVSQYRQEVAPRVILSGRWSYTLKYTPPTTEAEAMAKYAKSLGLPEEAIHIENESITTVSNLCLLKEQYLEPHRYRRILLVSLQLLSERALFNAKMVLGPDYTVDSTYADFSYSSEKAAQLVVQEQVKLNQAREFHSNNQAGDHKTIYEAAMKDLKDNYLESTQ